MVPCVATFPDEHMLVITDTGMGLDALHCPAPAERLAPAGLRRADPQRRMLGGRCGMSAAT
ncbi:hypothetical protein [Xylella taiwanensis]|uniref:hypothetical protein n=1 Tax=Xylella taiwanensis TaxID=1444770 RepID=UPI0004BC8581|nr:hypothetical protein [Xylella taiwanensis]MCD8463442.1 hypothetical protein [Xylella taiwanensis]UFN26614.1 hypothetical protein LPH51_08445 [Xylella taiwanensis]UFN40720.1 hypothetical protein LPH57_08485 [Xylella taiwanensis]